MTDTTWNVHTRRFGTVTAEAKTDAWHQTTEGEQASFRLWFDNSGLTDEQLVIQSGESHTVSGGDTEDYNRVLNYGSLTVESNATLNTNLRIEDRGGSTTNNGTINVNSGGGFSILDQYREFAGQAVTGTGFDGQPYWRPQTRSNPFIQSLLLGFEPNDELKDRGVTGVWGVVTGGSDERNTVLSNYQLRLDVFVLASYLDYADRQAVNNDLKA